VTTSNYSAIANAHFLQLTIARPKSSTSSLGVATQRLPTVGTSLPPTPRPRGDCLITLDSDGSSLVFERPLNVQYTGLEMYA
jgi:hypothetical protein